MVLNEDSSYLYGCNIHTKKAQTFCLEAGSPAHMKFEIQTDSGVGQVAWSLQL